MFCLTINNYLTLFWWSDLRKGEEYQSLLRIIWVGHVSLFPLASTPVGLNLRPCVQVSKNCWLLRSGVKYHCTSWWFEQSIIRDYWPTGPESDHARVGISRTNRYAIWWSRGPFGNWRYGVKVIILRYAKTRISRKKTGNWNQCGKTLKHESNFSRLSRFGFTVDTIMECSDMVRFFRMNFCSDIFSLEWNLFIRYNWNPFD